MSLRRPSATDSGRDRHPPTAGEQFARALAVRDSAALRALLADRIDFQALTPGRYWQAASAREVTEEIILGCWFGERDSIVELCSVVAGRVACREHVAYRVRVHREDGDYLVEQQAYYEAAGPVITWLRILCSGYQPVREPAPAPALCRRSARGSPRTG